MRSPPRSRSPRLRTAPSAEAREAILTEFARLYWMAPDGPDEPPWAGRRAAQIVVFRECLVAKAESSAPPPDPTSSDSEAGDRKDYHDAAYKNLCSKTAKSTVVRWQCFTFFEDTARMSDVLFRGPIEPRHADAVDLRLHNAWRRLHTTIPIFEEFNSAVCDFRVSAVRVAMMLETARPPEACEVDGLFELPDARALASLLSLRCEKDDAEELLEMYRLVCQKLHGMTCTWCSQPFDECSSAGMFDGGDTLVVPATVPKVFVPQCGHAIHTLCFGSQLIPDKPSGVRGLCRRCGLPYAWTPIDVDPMVNAFCWLFGPHVDKRAREMCAVGQVSNAAVMSIAEVCQSFSRELDGLVSPASAWISLTRRHSFSEPESMEVLSEHILQLLRLESPVPEPPMPLVEAAVLGPEDRSDTEASDGGEAFKPDKEPITEVFLPDPRASPRQLADDGALWCGRAQTDEEEDEDDCGCPMPLLGPPAPL